MPKIDIYSKIFICHYGKVASNTLAQSLADALKKKRTSIKTENRYYNEYILTTGLSTVPLINEYLQQNSYQPSESQLQDSNNTGHELYTAPENKIVMDDSDQKGWVSWTLLHPRLGRNVSLKKANNTSKTTQDEGTNSNKRVLVICVCRNLITRLISMYFQIHEKDVATKTVDQVISKLDLRYKSFAKLDTFPSDLVNNLSLGFDLYKELARKPIDSKYFLRIGQKIDFLLLKFENINEWPAVFKKVFGIPNFKLTDRNLSRDKDYYEIYQKVLETVKKNPQVINTYHRTNHFRIMGL